MRSNYEPVFFGAPEKELPPLNLTAADKKKFYRKGEAWKSCKPEDFEVIEGEIVREMRRINRVV